MLRLNAADEKVPPLGVHDVQVARALTLGALAEIAPFRARLVGQDEGREGPCTCAGRGRSCGEAVGRPPFGMGRAVDLIGRAGQLHPFACALGAAERVVAEILLPARCGAVRGQR